jgi:hypothetical protein
MFVKLAILSTKYIELKNDTSIKDSVIKMRVATLTEGGGS